MNLQTLSRRYFDEDEDSHETYNQILSTRIYLVVSIMSVFSLFIYTSTVSITEAIVIKQPSYRQYQQLITEKLNPQCRCLQTSIIFDQIADLHPQYHSICSSDFISDQWLDFLSNISQLSHLSLSDFRRTAVYSFQFLRSLCELAETNINEIIQQQLKFGSYISYHVKTDDIFREEIRSYVDTLIATEEVNFIQLIRTFSDLIHSQGLASTLSTNLIHYRDLPSVIPDAIHLYIHNRDRKYYNKKTHNDCRCYLSKCIQEYEIQDIQNSTVLFTVPNFYTGCFIVDSLRESSLKCFFSQTCIKELLLHLNSSLSITAININLSSNQSSKINQTIYELASHLMINKWNRTTNYHRYYDLCQPFQCVYTYEHRFVVGYIITVLSSIIGGLTIILGMLVPNVVKMIRKRKNANNEKISIRRWLAGRIKSFNLFKSTLPPIDYELVCLGIISTYIYMLVFLLLLIVLIIYTAVLPQKVTDTLILPSIEEYEHLKVQHADTLTCECTQIAIDLQTFIQLTPTYHQICSSIYITNIWYQYLTSHLRNRSSGILFAGEDFRTNTGRSIFRTLELFCKTSQENFQIKLNNLKSSSYITKEVVGRSAFSEQQNHIVELFKDDLRAMNVFSTELSVDIIQWNSLYSYIQLNYTPLVRYQSWLVHMAFSYFDGCQCIFQYRRCISAARIAVPQPNETNEYESSWEVPGFFEGCYPYYGTLPSSLFCLYNGSCLSELIHYLQPTSKLNVTVLKEHSSSSIFNSTTKIGELLYNSMIEQWNVSISYEQYYEKCKPKQCTYTYVKRFLVSYMISTILGIIGGLSWSLRLTVPNLVKLIRKIWITIRNKDDQDKDEINHDTGSKRLCLKIATFARNFNLFKSLSKRPPSIPVLEYEKQLRLKQQIISTRIYILFLFFLTITFILHTSLRDTAETKIFSVSSYSNYQNLSGQLGLDSLSCPCTLISSEYSNFLSIAPKSMHPANVNRLFDPRWMRLPISFKDVSIDENLPVIFVFYLQLMQNLGYYSVAFIRSRIKQFLTTFYTTSLLVDKEQFEKYFKVQIYQFQQVLTSQYKRAIDISRVMISSNSLLPAAKTNYEWDPIYTPEVLQLKTKWKNYRNQTYSCQIPSKFYKQQLYFPNTNIPVPGMYLSCYFIDGLLQSTFECFYNSTCLQLLQIHMLSPYNILAFKLDVPSNASLYRMNSTVQELVDVSFVEEWSNNITYELYYDKCHPKECHYTVIKSFQLLYVITTTFSVISGSVKVLPVLVPLLVKICYMLWKYIKGRKHLQRQRNNNRIKPVKPSLST